MPQFVAALLALIASFSHGGQPATTPPQFEDVTQLGSQVSEMAKNFHLSNLANEDGNTTGNDTENTSNNSGDNHDNFGALASNHTVNDPRIMGRDFGKLISSHAQNQTQNQSQNQTQNETGNQSENETENQDASGNQTSNNGADPDTTKVPANNIHSGFQMPTNLPQVALDHSTALEPVDPSVSPFPLPPGHRK